MKEENGWVGGENESARWKLQGLSYLNYFCYILLITQTNPSTMWGKLDKGVNTRGRDHWGLSLRLPTAMEVEDKARKQEENRDGLEGQPVKLQKMAQWEQRSLHCCHCDEYNLQSFSTVGHSFKI